VRGRGDSATIRLSGAQTARSKAALLHHSPKSITRPRGRQRPGADIGINYRESDCGRPCCQRRQREGWNHSRRQHDHHCAAHSTDWPHSNWPNEYAASFPLFHRRDFAKLGHCGRRGLSMRKLPTTSALGAKRPSARQARLASRCRGIQPPATLRLATLSRSRVCAKAGARGTVGDAEWSPSFIQRKPRVGQNDGQQARRCEAH
jgi:hypothetical protein